MVRGGALAGAAIAVAAFVTACGGRPASDWVASEVYVVDDRLSCMTVTEKEDGREIGVCRDTEGRVSCRLTPGGPLVTRGSDCDAAIRAVRAWEASYGAV